MGKTAGDVMVRDVISLSSNTPLIDAYMTLVDNRITGAPVVDENQHVVGVVSMTDFMDAINEHKGLREPFLDEFYAECLTEQGLTLSDDVHEQLEDLSVQDAMTSDALSVAPDDPVSKVAGMMRKNHIHRVLVIHDSVLVGIISSMDLVKILESD